MKTIYTIWLPSYSRLRIGIFTWDGVRQETARPELLKPPLRKSKPWVSKYSCMFWILYLDLDNWKASLEKLQTFSLQYQHWQWPMSVTCFVFHLYHFLDHLDQLQLNVLDITSWIWTIGRGLLTWGRSLLSLLQSICKCKTLMQFDVAL